MKNIRKYFFQNSPNFAGIQNFDASGTPCRKKNTFFRLIPTPLTRYQSTTPPPVISSDQITYPATRASAGKKPQRLRRCSGFPSVLGGRRVGLQALASAPVHACSGFTVASATLVERFDIEPFSDFSAKIEMIKL